MEDETDTPDTNDDDSSSDGSPDTTSDDTELTPEQRDEATIARLSGNEPAQDDESKEDEKTDDADEAAADADDSASDDADESTDGDEAADETKDSAPAGDGAGDEESDADADVELTDDDIETFIDAAEGRIVASPRMQKVIEGLATAAADKMNAQRLEQTEVSQETQRLLDKGGTAAKSIEKLFGTAAETLIKYVAGETVEEEVVLDPEDLKGHLKDFAVAAAVRTRQAYDSAFATTFRDVAPLTGKAFTEVEAKEVIKIVETADRIRNDPEQGEMQATAYLFKESTKYLVERALKSGAEAEREGAAKRREATKRVIGNKTDTKTALAKIAAKRKKVAPASPKQEPSSEGAGEFTMEAYRAAKLAGKPDEADKIMAGMAASGQGHPVDGR